MIFTGIAFSSALFIAIFSPEINYMSILLLQMFIMAALSTLGNLIFYSMKEVSKKSMRIRTIINYLYVNLIVYTMAFVFNWINFNSILQLVLMFVLILLVYIVVYITNYIKGEMEAKAMNLQLSRFHEEENETEERDE
jgi:fatty acid desaturase